MFAKNDITEVRSFAKPPPAVQIVMEGVCALLGEKTDWETVKKVVLGDVQFLERLKAYDKDHVDEKALERVRKTLAEPNMQIEVVSKVGLAACALSRSRGVLLVHSRRMLSVSESHLLRLLLSFMPCWPSACGVLGSSVGTGVS